MIGRQRFSYIFIFLGFVLGFVLLLLDRWIDTHNKSYIFSWSAIILFFTIFGGVIGSLLEKIFHAQRKREEDLQEEHKRLYDLLESLPGIVMVLDEAFTVRFANRNCIMEFGTCETEFCFNVVGKMSPCNNCMVLKVFQNNLPVKNEELFLNNRTYEAILQPFRDVDGSNLVIKILYDITERKMAEQELSCLKTELAHLERLNLVGQLAAGLAHEIRNPMTTVRGYLQFLENKPEFQSYGSKFELMIEELDRANLIISEFLSFVKNRPTEVQYQNINDILQHLYPLIEADAFSQNKQLFLETKETPDIPLNAKEISQLVLNLCRNGFEAMQGRGTLTIRTYFEGEQVVLAVQDEGCGIPSEYLDKLGTPFFTTKENGTGLGIATCYSIADRHSAKIDFVSGPGGTIFFVRFPCPAINQ